MIIQYFEGIQKICLKILYWICAQEWAAYSGEYTAWIEIYTGPRSLQNNRWTNKKLGKFYIHYEK